MPETLAALLPYLEPDAVEVHLLRHYTKASKPKSRHHMFSVDRDLWDEPAIDIQLAPECAEKLAAMGFAISPLQIERQDSDPRMLDITVTTSLTRTRHRTVHGQQFVRLQLVFKVPRNPNLSSSVTCDHGMENYLLCPLRAAVSGQLLGEPHSSLDFRTPLGSPWVRIDTADGVSSLYRHVRVFTTIDFILRTIDDWADELPCPRARVLRFTAEQPVGDGGHRPLNTGILWLSFELSDSYRTDHSSRPGRFPADMRRLLVDMIVHDI